MYYNSKYRVEIIICITYFTSNDIFINVAECLSQKFKMPERFMNSIASPFSEIKKIYSPINLEQGSPDMVPPTFLRNSLSEAAESWNSTYHQYTDPTGNKQLVQEVALLYSTLMNRKLDPTQNVLITVGATEALYLIFQAYTSPGDEWILIEPVLTIFPALIKMAQGTPKYVLMKPNNTEGITSSRDWTFDRDEMTKAFNKKTKGIVVNSPHNPTGKIFTKEELRFISDLANKWDVLVIVDEVYDSFVYDSNEIIKMAALSNEIFERSITVNAISKNFLATGWRLGWAIAPAEVIRNLKMIHTCIILTHPTPIQIAAIDAIKRSRLELGQPLSFASNTAKLSQMKRDRMMYALSKIGASFVVPEGGFFIFLNYTSLEPRAFGLEREVDDPRDYRFIKWAVKNIGVLFGPGSDFYGQNKKVGEDYVRIAFVKRRDTIEKASNLLLDWFLQ